jgi:N-acetylneuraminic acid mutarotase
MIVWGPMTSAGAGRYNPLTDAWTRTSTAGAPAGKMYSTAVWTGTEMLVWGGDSNADNVPSAGGRYNPSTDTWQLMTLVAAPAARRMHSAVWTGTEMVVWGGSQFGGALLNTGGRYNPATDSWQPTSTVGAPTARYGSTAVWTGTEMVVWGGSNGDVNSNASLLNTGGRYNPSSDTWQPTSSVGVPAARSNHRAVWTGSMMIVWGGNVAGVVGPQPTYTGARYNPASDVWTATSNQSAASSRSSHVQVWTGTQMIVWGGINGESALTSDGGVYNAPGGTPGNNPPSVRLTSPADGAPFEAGNNIRIDAEASDGDGTVSSVSFYANDTLLGTDRDAPFSFTWNGVRSGSYALTAAATDDAGGITRSAPVNINVEALIGPPNAVITSPADGATFEAPATIHVTADVRPNPDYDVTKVEFYLSNGQGTQTLVNTDTTAPYGFDLTNQAEGSYVIYAHAHDGQDVGISPGARFTVTGPARPFNISGQVADSRGVGIGGLAVKLTGTDTATATTNTNGFYFFGSLVQGGNYTVTPSATNYSYAPQSRTFDNLAGTKADANFVATPVGHGISGRLTDSGGNPVFPATVNLSGSKVATTGTDVNGNYFFSNLAPGGTYTVQPIKNLYTFEPGFRTFENLSAEQTANFTGTPQGTTFSIGGRVVDSGGAPVAGLRVRLDTTQVVSTKFRTTDANGLFNFDNLQSGETCKVWPEDFTYAYDFAPATRLYTALGQNVSDANFVATPRTVSGRIIESGSGIAGVTVTLNGPQTGTATTGNDGSFAFRGVALRGDYTVAASKPGYNFTPTQYTLTDLKEDVTANFAGAPVPTPTPTPTPSPTPTPVPVEPKQFVLAGAASFEEGGATAALTVRRTGDVSQPSTVDYETADGTARQGYDYMLARGTLRFEAGESEKHVTLLLVDDAYDEADEVFTLTLSKPSGGAQLGEPSATQIVIKGGETSTSPNPVDAARFFVRQHYADFLNRAADEAGLDFWAGQIERCGADAGCAERRRVEVSAAFFLSIEFQETGYLVYRLQKATDGRMPRYADFMRQAQEVGGGVVVNAPEWQERLEANKREFAERWAQSDAFKSRYGAMSDAEYVDALIANVGVELGRETRDALVLALRDGSETRAGALRRVAEHESVRRAEQSRAFVLMQYFGYLRRNPDDAPDANMDGYAFWLGKLDGFGGDWRRAEMVKAFVSATEYRRRFGL